jgi:hypothetical protein
MTGFENRVVYLIQIIEQFDASAPYSLQEAYYQRNQDKIDGLNRKSHSDPLIEQFICVGVEGQSKHT